MAKRGATIDMGRHKAVGSSWRSMDTQAYSHAYQPETRPDFQCYVDGQQANMQAAYEATQKKEAMLKALLDLKQRMLDKNLV
jgi:hypothetical protein